MCAIGTLEFIVDDSSPPPSVPRAPYFAWSAPAAALFTGSFGLTMIAVGGIHLCSDRSEGGNSERASAICVISLVCQLALGDLGGAVSNPLTHLTVFTFIGFVNAYFDSMGFLHFWWAGDGTSTAGNAYSSYMEGSDLLSSINEESNFEATEA